MHDKSMPSGNTKKTGRNLKEKRATKRAKKEALPKHRKRIAQAQP